VKVVLVVIYSLAAATASAQAPTTQTPPVEPGPARPAEPAPVTSAVAEPSATAPDSSTSATIAPDVEADSVAAAGAVEQPSSDSTSAPVVAAESNQTDPDAPVPTGGLPAMRGVSWDFELELGVGFAVQGDLDDELLGRARGGVLFIQEPFFLSVGVTGEVGGLAGYGVGLQGDLIHLWGGYTFQVGAEYAEGGAWIVHAGLGYAILSAEWQHDFDTDADALFFKLRIPIGIVFYGMSHQ